MIATRAAAFRFAQFSGQRNTGENLLEFFCPALGTASDEAGFLFRNRHLFLDLGPALLAFKIVVRHMILP